MIRRRGKRSPWRGAAPALTALALAAQLALAAPARAQADSLSLLDAVRRALSTQPAVTGAGAALDAARAGRAAARAAWLPFVSLDAGITRFEEPMIVTPLHGFDPDILMHPPEFDERIVDATLAARWTVFEGGARLARSRAAAARARAAAAALEGTEDAVIAATVMAYADAVAARETLAAHDRRLEALAAEHDRVEKALAEGGAAGVELSRAAAALAGGRADRVAAAADLDVAAGVLARQTGLPDTGASLANRLALPAIAPRETAGGPAAAPGAGEGRPATESPAVRRARGEAEAARAAVQAARGAWWPDVSAQGALVERGAAGEPDTYSNEWQVALRLAWPVFTGGARKAEVDRAEAEARGAEARLRQAELDQAEQVERAAAALERARARETALAEAVEAQAEVARVERLALDVGAGVQADWLDAEADLLAARAALVQARAGAVVATVELARANGALDVEWLAAHLASPAESPAGERPPQPEETP